jgi:hypothetical protein
MNNKYQPFFISNFTSVIRSETDVTPELDYIYDFDTQKSLWLSEARATTHTQSGSHFDDHYEDNIPDPDSIPHPVPNFFGN